MELLKIKVLLYIFINKKGIKNAYNLAAVKMY